MAEGADIWSCGVILYALICGYLPYDDDPTNQQGDNINALYKYILETKLQFPSNVSLEAQHLVLRILVTNPEKRATMQEIRAHKFVFRALTVDGLLRIATCFPQSPSSLWCPSGRV